MYNLDNKDWRHWLMLGGNGDNDRMKSLGEKKQEICPFFEHL